MKAGVMLLDLVDAEQYQMSLLHQPARDHHPLLMATIDQINQRMGQGTISFGMTDAPAAWQLRCAHRSDRYTTRWDELMKVGTYPGAVAAAEAKQKEKEKQKKQQALTSPKRSKQPRA